MMLSALRAIADDLDLEFLFGDDKSFNVVADEVVSKTGADPIVLYHEGYVEGSLAEDAQGAFDAGYDVRLWLLLPSEFTDTPVFRRPGFEQLEPLMHQVLRALKKHYTLTGIRFREGVNLTSRNLDGIRFTMSAVPKITERQC